MGRTPQEDLEQAGRRAKVADLYLQGVTQAQIAARLGYNQATVSRDLQAIHAEWRESRIRDMDDLKTRELERIDRIEREAWTAWERSKLDAVSIKQSIASEDDTDGKELERTIKGQAGDPRFLEVVSKCIDKRCKILGLDAPIKTENKTTLAVIEEIVDARDDAAEAHPTTQSPA